MTEPAPETLHAALKQAVAAAGNNQSRFAALIGSSQQNVSYWLKNEKPLPGEYVLKAEREGLGSRHVLRPDLYPIEDDAAAANVAICSRCDERADGEVALSCTSVHCPMRQAEAA